MNIGPQWLFCLIRILHDILPCHIIHMSKTILVYYFVICLNDQQMIIYYNKESESNLNLINAIRKLVLDSDLIISSEQTRY